MAKRNIEIKKRGKNTRNSRSVFLIIAEGKNKTETLYFSNYQMQGREYSIKFVKAGNNTDAESLYNTICSKWEELGLSEDRGDRGFVILDIDNDDSKAQKVVTLIKKNKNPAISFVVSNPAFEIWFLIHFRFTTKFYKDGNAVIADLLKFIPDYEKSKDCFSLINDKTAIAIQNSSKLRSVYDEQTWPSIACNPRTDVDQLVKLLGE